MPYQLFVMCFGCRPPGTVDCLVNVVTEQCGDELAGPVRSFLTQVQEIYLTNCAAEHKRQ